MLSVLYLAAMWGGEAAASYAPYTQAWDEYAIAWHPHRRLLATAYGILRLGPESTGLTPWVARPPSSGVGYTFAGCDWSADGAYLVATRLSDRPDWHHAWDVIRIDVTSGAVSVLADAGFGYDNVGPKCSPTGATVAFFSQPTFAAWSPPRHTAPRLACVPIGGGTPRVLVEHVRPPMVWARTGDRLVASSPISGSLVVPLKSGEVLPLRARGVEYPYPQAWLPGGRLLCIGHVPGDADAGLPGRGLYAVNWRTGASELLYRLSDRSQNFNSAAVSPDGRRVACVREDDEAGWDLLLINIRAGMARRLAHVPRLTRGVNTSMHGPPSWSPDGKRIAYWRELDYASATSELWIVAADGSGGGRVWP